MISRDGGVNREYVCAASKGALEERSGSPCSLSIQTLTTRAQALNTALASFLNSCGDCR
jgi:hypothetical protein